MDDRLSTAGVLLPLDRVLVPSWFLYKPSSAISVEDPVVDFVPQDISDINRGDFLVHRNHGVGICAGADLVGRRAVLCMQSSGVGNCPNFLSLIKGGGFPIFLLVTMRGDYGEQNPWQYPMGQAVEPVLKAMGIQTIRVERQDELEEATTAAVSGAFKANQGIALVLSQKFLGTKEF